MGYVRDTTLGEIRLEGDDFGASSARIQLPAAPAGAKKMQVVFRTWFDTISTDTATDGKGWNHSECFGLRFSSAIPKYPASFVAPFEAWLPTDFFGIIKLGPASADNTPPISGTPTFKTAISGNRRGNSLNVANGFSGDSLAMTASSADSAAYELFSFMNGIGGYVFADWFPSC
jgi:hypothetical protein